MDDDLDRMLGGLRGRGPVPSDRLMARVLADAAAQQPRPAAPRAAGRGWWRGLAGAFGGAGAVAGLASAAAAGLFLGLAVPAPADALTAALWGGEAAVELFPTLDEVMTDDAR
jgi:hypothetical protein